MAEPAVRLLDAVMHVDMRPLRPFAEGNPFLLATSLPALHLFCVASGAIGIVWLLARGGSPVAKLTVSTPFPDPA